MASGHAQTSLSHNVSKPMTESLHNSMTCIWPTIINNTPLALKHHNICVRRALRSNSGGLIAWKISQIWTISSASSPKTKSANSKRHFHCILILLSRRKPFTPFMPKVCKKGEKSSVTPKTISSTSIKWQLTENKVKSLPSEIRKEPSWRQSFWQQASLRGLPRLLRQQRASLQQASSQALRPQRER